jgi:hypothetical protein
MARPFKDPVKALAVIAKDLIENNASIADVGTILGTLQDTNEKWLLELKKECSTVEEFCNIASKRADIALISAAMREAIGYDYTEVQTDEKRVPDTLDENGEPLTWKWVETGYKKMRKRHQKGNDALLRFILKNRLPEFFQDIQKVEINKKVVEVHEIAEKEIMEFGKQIIAKFETDK